MKKILLLLLVVISIFQPLKAQKFLQIRWQNQPRNFIVYLPRNFSPSENLPLVINMHGFLTTSQFQMDYSQFNKTADSVRCIVIYPEGVDLRWNSGTFFFVSSTIDDVGFLSNLMDRAAVLYNADMKKVFSMGYSAGGFMSYKLACDLTNRVAAIAPNVGSMVNDNLNSCVPARPINIAAFNGSSDPITPYAGFPGNFPGIDSIKHFWQIKNACNVEPIIDTLPDLRNDGTRVVRYNYQNCNENVGQVFYKVINGGHVWPGANDIFLGILGKTTQDISMNNESWNFFKTKEIPASVRCDAPANLQSNTVMADSFLLNWNAIPGVLNYKVALVDDSDKVTFYETSDNSFAVKINPLKQYRWNVAALCNSGYHNWNTSRTLNGVLSSINNKQTQKLKVFPNPANHTLYLDLPKGINETFDLLIYNLLGEVVFTNTAVSSDNNKIEVSSLAKGCYQLKIESENTTYSSSFVVE